jgi:DNA repair exonuclease SbcCD ATPase subunit
VRTVGCQLREVSAAHDKAKEELEKIAFRREKTAAALAPYQELKAVGGSVTQIFDMLEVALEEAEFDHRRGLESYTTLDKKLNTLLKELNELAKSVVSTKAKLDEATQLKTDFEQSQSAGRKFRCSIRMTTDARNEDGHLFGDLTFDFEAIARQRQDGVDSD